MSLQRWAAKADATQEDIVRKLRDIGVECWHIRKPCDLLTRFYCDRHGDHCWVPIEVKTPHGKKQPKPRFDKRQKAQEIFLRTTNTPVVTSFEEAWRALNLSHRLRAVNVQ